MKPIIGLAGGPGSGKSLVAKVLAAEGCAVVDADALAKQALDEPDIIQQLRHWWGDTVVDKQGNIDRGAVGKIVFDQPEELRRLEGMIHPRVLAWREALHQQYLADQEVRAIVEDCPLLFEAGLAGACDVVIFVKCSREVRENRVLKNRGWTAEELVRREKNQWPLDMKASRADYIVDNDASEVETTSQIRVVLSKIFNE